MKRAAGMTGLPPVRQVNANDTEFEGYQPKEGDPPSNVDYYQTATVGYFESMGIRIREGRGLDERTRHNRNGLAAEDP